MGLIYMIYNDVNDKVYIGQTKQPLKDRWYIHQYNAKNKVHDYYIYRAMNYHGIDKFHIKELERCPNEQLNEKEIYYIEKYNSFAPNGYNSTKGGDGVQRYDYKEIIQHYLNCNENISECMRKYGYAYVTIRNAMLEFNMKPHIGKDGIIYECDVDNNIIKEFGSYQEVIDAYPDLYFDKTLFSEYLHKAILPTEEGKKRFSRYRGKLFCRAEEYEIFKTIDHHNRGYKPIVCLQTGEEFESISAAARWVKEHDNTIKGTITTIVGNIGKAIQNNWNSYGYTWKRID